MNRNNVKEVVDNLLHSILILQGEVGDLAKTEVQNQLTTIQNQFRMIRPSMEDLDISVISEALMRLEAEIKRVVRNARRGVIRTPPRKRPSRGGKKRSKKTRRSRR